MRNKVWTPQGLQSGPFNSLVGKGETIYNPNDGSATLVTRGKKGVDDLKSSVQEGDDNVILGNDTDWRTGRKFSDTVAPYTAMKQFIDKSINKIKKFADKSSLSRNTLKVQQQNYAPIQNLITNALEDSRKQQLVQHLIQDYSKQISKYNCGKNKYYPGKDGEDLPYPWRNNLTEYDLSLYNSPNRKLLFSKLPWDKVGIPAELYGYMYNDNPQYTYRVSGVDGELYGYDAETGLPAVYNSDSVTKPTSVLDYENNTYNIDEVPAIGVKSAYKPETRIATTPVDNSTISPWYEQAIGMSVPAMNAIRQNMYWNSQPITKRNSYFKNEYEPYVLNKLAKMKVSSYADEQALNQKLREARYSNAQAGKLTAALRNLNNIALALGNQAELAKLRKSYADTNMLLDEKMADAMANLGNANREAQIKSYMYDTDQYDKAHGRKVEGIERAMVNLGNIWQQMAADRNTINIADKNLGIYQQKVNDLDRQFMADLAQKDRLMLTNLQIALENSRYDALQDKYNSLSTNYTNLQNTLKEYLKQIESLLSQLKQLKK